MVESERTVSKPSETVPTNLRSETLVPVAVMANSFFINGYCDSLGGGNG
jgi:hypothetical protein